MESPQRPPHSLLIEELLSIPGDTLETPHGTYWVTSSERCPCGDDDGLRFENPYRPDSDWYCDGCGDLANW